MQTLDTCYVCFCWCRCLCLCRYCVWLRHSMQQIEERCKSVTKLARHTVSNVFIAKKIFVCLIYTTMNTTQNTHTHLCSNICKRLGNSSNCFACCLFTSIAVVVGPNHNAQAHHYRYRATICLLHTVLTVANSSLTVELLSSTKFVSLTDKQVIKQTTSVLLSGKFKCQKSSSFDLMTKLELSH